MGHFKKKVWDSNTKLGLQNQMSKTCIFFSDPFEKKSNKKQETLQKLYEIKESATFQKMD